MTALRCTAKLLKAMKQAPDPAPAPASNRLGEWTANLVRVGRLQLVIAVSEHTRLGLVVDAAPYASLGPRLLLQLARTLEWLEVPQAMIAAELLATGPLVVAKTNSASLLGALTQFAWQAEGQILGGRAHSGFEVTQVIAEMPIIRPAHIGFPALRVREAFGLPPRRMSWQDRLESIVPTMPPPQRVQ